LSSNAAATNIPVPLGFVFATGFETLMVVAIALGASLSERLNLSDFMQGAIILRTLAPMILIARIYCILMNFIL